MNKNLMPVEQKALPPENEIRLLPEEVKSLPETVQKLFSKLDPKKQNLIFETQILETRTETIENVNNDKFAELVAGVSESEREELAIHCLTQLLDDTDIYRTIRFSNVKGISKNVERFLNIAWANRGKSLETVEIYCKNKYDEYHEKLPDAQKELERAQADVAEMKASLIKTERQKRLTERKQEKLDGLLAKLRHCQFEVDTLNRRFSNTADDHENNTDIESRTIKERYFFQALGTVMQYYDVTEFEVLIHEMFELHVFKYDKSLMESGKYPESSNIYKMAQYRIRVFELAVDRWAKGFSNPKTKKKMELASLNKKTRTMVEYFLELYDSYSKDVAKNRPEDEMIYTVRQMEISLRLLKKL